ncbi:hypothetical protein [Gottfriedia luciferensis]|uniref:hypothetical protein n=1 Tax=Gottfriedia luciferensis TaxID=178774 RepID=UPI001155178B|nr:hypothetical protein [Gottfriedia luciferensis]
MSENESLFFLVKNSSGKEMVSLNSFTKTNKGYVYDSGGEFAKNYYATVKEEFILVSRVGSKTSLVFWGYVANYPNADGRHIVIKIDL